MRGDVIFGLVGILIAAAAQFIALMLAGAGHGWIMPIWFSAALWLLGPLVLIRFKRWRAGKAGRPALDLSLVLLALALDAALIMKTVDEAAGQFMRTADYFMKIVAAGPALVVLWIMFWLSWQVGALFLLSRKA